MSEPKKISFGFSKLTKKTNLVLAQNSVKNAEKKVELIDCLEGQSIKIKDAVVIDDSPLIIPVKGNDKNLLDRVREANELKERSLKKHEELEDTRPDSELTLDELAARQLLREAKNYDGPKKNVKVYSLPAIEDKLVLEGSKEPTINDYENVPISEYGLAMLRGMGWKDGQGIGKSTSINAVAAPELRPKGMGLGANKMVNSEKQAKPATDKDGKELCLIKGIHAKVIAGKEKGNYCTVQGLDDEGGRVIVKMALKGDILTFNEFLLIPVTADEYAKCSKVLNNAKYEEFKGKTGNQNDGAVKFEKPANPPMKPSRDDRSRSRSNSVENTKSSKSDESNKYSETIKKHSNSDFYEKTVDSEHNEKSRDKKHRDSTDDSDDGRRKKDGENYRSGSKNDDRKDRDDYNDKRSRYDKNSKGDYERRNDKNRDEDYDRRSRNERDNKYRDEDYEGRSRNEKDNRYRDENYERRSRNEKDSRYKDEDYERRSRNEKDSRYKDEDNERKSRKEKDSRHKDDDYDRKSKKYGDEDNQRKSRSDKKNDSDDDYDRKKRDDSSEDRDRRKEKKHKKKKNKSRSRSRSAKRKSRKNEYSSDEEQTNRKKSSKKKKKSKRRSPSSSSEEDHKKASRSRRERSYSSDSSSDDDRRRRRKNK